MTGPRRFALPASLLALAIVVWTVPLQFVSLWTTHQINPDVHLYLKYGRAIAQGAVPYRDVRIEYPPGATGIFAAVWWIPGNYVVGFSALMLACLCVCILGVIATARALGYSPVRQALAGGVIALSPLLLGSLIQARFDLAVAAIVAWMLYAAVTGRWKLMWALLAAGVLIKLIPIALLPLLVVWQAHRVDWRSALRGAGASILLVALVIVPFAVISPSGTWYFIAYNLRRPPQLESMAASAYLAVHAVTGLHVAVVNNYGSFGLSGRGPAIVATALTVGLVVLVLLCAAWCARLLSKSYPTRDVEILIAGAATTMVALTVTGKVLSPVHDLAPPGDRLGAWSLGPLGAGDDGCRDAPDSGLLPAALLAPGRPRRQRHRLARRAQPHPGGPADALLAAQVARNAAHRRPSHRWRAAR